MSAVPFTLVELATPKAKGKCRKWNLMLVKDRWLWGPPPTPMLPREYARIGHIRDGAVEHHEAQRDTGLSRESAPPTMGVGYEDLWPKWLPDALGERVVETAPIFEDWQKVWPEMPHLTWGPPIRLYFTVDQAPRT